MNFLFFFNLLNVLHSELEVLLYFDFLFDLEFLAFKDLIDWLLLKISQRTSGILALKHGSAVKTVISRPFNFISRRETFLELNEAELFEIFLHVYVFYSGHHLHRLWLLQIRGRFKFKRQIVINLSRAEQVLFFILYIIVILSKSLFLIGRRLVVQTVLWRLIHRFLTLLKSYNP